MTEPQANIADEKTIVRPGTGLPWLNIFIALVMTLSIFSKSKFLNVFTTDNTINISTMVVVAGINLVIFFERWNLKKVFGAWSFVILDARLRKFYKANGCAWMLGCATLLGLASLFLSSKFDFELPDSFSYSFVWIITYVDFVSLRKEKRTLENLSEEDKGFLLAGKSIIF